MIALFYTGCLKQYDNIIFFEDYPNSQAWIGDIKVEINGMKKEKRRKYIRFSYDSVSSKLFAWNSDNNFEHLYFADVSNGYYTEDKEICLDIPMKLDAQFVFLYNNKSLIEYRWGLYGIVDLTTGSQYFIDIRGKVDSNIAMGTIGYDEQLILFCNGYYNILEGNYCPYSKKLDSPRAIPDENIIIGYDANKFVNIYNYITNEIKTIKIRRTKFNSGLEYLPSDLFFLCGSNLYIAADNICIENILIFVRKPANRKWYKYNLANGKKERIHTPSGYTKILGETDYNN
jgi:hypothetical protein